MADTDLISAYLNELRYSAARLGDVDDIVDEAEDHLLSAVDAAVARGRDRREAEADALARFGSAALVARIHVEEARRGGAVSTTTTRYAGVAGMLFPALLILGQTGNERIPRGFMHGVALVVLAAGVAAFFYALWGLRLRHGGLGGWGRAAFWLFVASPFLSAPFAWGAGVAFICVQLIVAMLLGIGMLRARVLPPPPVAMFAFTPGAVLGVAAGVSALGADAGPLFPLGIALFSFGMAWIGWVLWREPALDVRNGRNSGPLAA